MSLFSMKMMKNLDDNLGSHVRKPHLQTIQIIVDITIPLNVLYHDNISNYEYITPIHIYIYVCICMYNTF